MRGTRGLAGMLLVAAAVLRCSTFTSNGDAPPDATADDGTPDAPAMEASTTDAGDAGVVDGRVCAPDAHYRCADFDENDTALPGSFTRSGGVLAVDSDAAFSGARSLLVTSAGTDSFVAWDTTEPIGRGVLRVAERREEFGTSYLDDLVVAAIGPAARATCVIEQLEPSGAQLNGSWLSPDGGGDGTYVSTPTAAFPKGTWGTIALEFHFDEATPRCLAYVNGMLAGSLAIPNMPSLTPSSVRFEFGHLAYFQPDAAAPASVTRFDDLVVDTLP